MKRLSVILTLLALLLVGCNQGTGAGEFSEIKVSLTGGFAGFNKWMAIASDGSYQIVDREKEAGRGQIGGDDLTALKEAVARVEWARLQPQYVDPRVADAMFETVTVTIGGKTYTTAVGTGGSPPAELAALNALLRHYLSDVQPQ